MFQEKNLILYNFSNVKWSFQDKIILFYSKSINMGKLYCCAQNHTCVALLLRINMCTIYNKKPERLSTSDIVTIK